MRISIKTVYENIEKISTIVSQSTFNKSKFLVLFSYIVLNSWAQLFIKIFFLS